LSPNARVHWSKKSKATKRYKANCWALTKEAKAKIDWDGPIVVSMTFFPPNRCRRDIDNLIASSKALLDGMALALGVDDSRFYLRQQISEDLGGLVRVRLSVGLV
jgi:crossover junction endodeoxyribonuclease RusA